MKKSYGHWLLNPRKDSEWNIIDKEGKNKILIKLRMHFRAELPLTLFHIHIITYKHLSFIKVVQA